jgi:autotransporter-associated beta strand protein
MRRRPRFETLEERLALATLDITGTTLTVTLGTNETCEVGGDSLDGSSGVPLYFEATDGSSAMALSGSAATYFTLSTTTSTDDTATLQAGQSLASITAIVIVNGDDSNPGMFTFGDGTSTLPTFNAAILTDADLALVVFQSGVATTGYDQSYNGSTNIIDGDVTFTGANISFAGTIDTNGATTDDRLTLDASGSVTLSGTIGQTHALSYLSITNGSGSVDLAATKIDGDDAELRLDLAASLTQSGILSGSMDLTIEGGTVTLDEANTFTGDTTLQDGTLNLNRAGGATLAGNVIVGDGTGDAASAAVVCLANNQLVGSATVTTYADGRFTLSENYDLTIGGLTMTGGEVVSGVNGTLTLAGNATTLACDSEATLSGTLSLGSATRTFTVADGDASNDLVISAEISNGGLIKAGAGTLELNGANSYTGTTTINAGTLLVSNNSALGTTDGNTVVNADATLALSGVTISENLEIGSMVAVEATGSVQSYVEGNVLLTADSGVGGTHHLCFDGVISDGGNGYGLQINSTGYIVSFTAANTYTGTTTVLRGVLDLSNTSGNSLAGDLTIGGGASSASVWVQYADQLVATAKLTLLNRYAAVYFTSGSVTQTIADLEMTGGTLSIGSGTLTVTGGVTTNAYTQAATISGNLNLGGDACTFTVANGTAASDLTASAVVSNGSLTKAGAGTLTLSGTNTYAGATTVNAGTLLISNNAALGTTDGNTVVNADATLALSGVTLDEDLEIGSTVGLWGTGNAESVLTGDILLTADSGIVADQVVTLSGVISDGVLGDGYGMQLTSGRVYLMGANTYRGVTTVLDGDLLLRCESGVAIQGDVIIGDGTGDAQSAKLNELFADQMATTTEMTVYSDGWYCLMGSTQSIASLTMTGGLLSSSGGTLTLTGNVATNAAATAAAIETDLDLNGGTCTFTVADGTAASDLVISAVISNGALIKAGAGTLELSGTNTFDGEVEIAAGTLLVTADANLGAVPGEVTADAIVLSGGTLLAGSTFTLDANRGIQLDESTVSTIAAAADATLTYDGILAGVGTLCFDGEGTVSVGGVQSCTGTTTLAAGTLVVNGSLATSAITVTGGTLTGSGTVGAVSASGGTIGLDATLGTLSGTQLDAQSGATFSFTVDTAGELAADSQLALSGTLTLGSALLVLDAIETYDVGESVVLATADGGISGVFSNAGDGALVQASSGQYFQIRITTTQVTATAVDIYATTIGSYDGATATFALRYSNTEGEADTTFAYGVAGAGWIAIVGDWDGDGIQTVGLFDPTESMFYLRNSNSTGNADISFAYGAADAGWTPVVGDWNNDGIDTVGLYDPATAEWYLRNSNSGGVADLSFAYGVPGANWTPVVGDWNGDGTDTVGLNDAETANWYLRNANSSGVADLSFGYGTPGSAWSPVTGDWNASGTTTIGLYDADSATWFLRDSNTSGAADHEFTFGTAGSDVQTLSGVWTMPLYAKAVDQLDLAALADEALSGIS